MAYVDPHPCSLQAGRGRATYTGCKLGAGMNATIKFFVLTLLMTGGLHKGAKAAYRQPLGVLP